MSIHSPQRKKKNCNGDSRFYLYEHNELNSKVYIDNSLYTRLTLFV